MASVFADVAEDIGQLKRHPTIQDRGGRQGIAESPDMNTGQAHRGGGQVAEVFELFVGFESSLLLIHQDAVDDFQ